MSGIYLAFTSDPQTEQRTALLNTLIKAGQQVFPSDTTFDGNLNKIVDSIQRAQASVHLLGLSYENSQAGGISIEQEQYRLALEKKAKNPEHKIYIWFPFSVAQVQDDVQLNFINEIRNSISEGIVFSNVNSQIQFADDVRISGEIVSKQEFNINPTDVFLIHNQLDDHEANEVADMLSDIVPIEKLNIVQDSDLDYSEFCAQQIGKSKLAVVYFKESADWALPFTQQIWKKVGGASSHTPILLIGDEDPETNLNKKFKAPKVVSLIVSGELVPLEIKMTYDKAVEGGI